RTAVHVNRYSAHGWSSCANDLRVSRNSTPLKQSDAASERTRLSAMAVRAAPKVPRADQAPGGMIPGPLTMSMAFSLGDNSPIAERAIDGRLDATDARARERGGADNRRVGPRRSWRRRSVERAGAPDKAKDSCSTVTGLRFRRSAGC